jgi:hypothetical protein
MSEKKVGFPILSPTEIASIIASMISKGASPSYVVNTGEHVLNVGGPSIKK